MNLAIGSPGLRYKESSMPFVQMENISHFLRACQSPPMNLPPHDVFLTVDLYEAKDPAQVLQCLGAFSRRAHNLQPGKFPTAIGKTKAGIVSPQTTGAINGGYLGGVQGASRRDRGTSNTSDSSTSTFGQPSRTYGGRASPTKVGGATSPSGGTSTWSRKADEGVTMPAWNIAQYGYMGGASQGNQGITFGGRRQITTPGPKVPSLAEKERKRREEEAETERLRVQAEEAEYKRKVEREAEESRERIAEERRWEEETRKQKDKARKDAEEEKRRWEEDERRWNEEEEARLREEREVEARLEKERQRNRAGSDARLKSQFLSQYQAEQNKPHGSSGGDDSERVAERERVKDLERQLEEAKERERQYERERQNSKLHGGAMIGQHQHNQTVPIQPHVVSQPSEPAKEEPWPADERECLRGAWSRNQPNATETPPPQPPRPLPDTSSFENAPPQPPRVAPQSYGSDTPPPQPPRPLPTPQSFKAPDAKAEKPHPQLPTRPIPSPGLSPQNPNLSRTDRFLSTNSVPTTALPTSYTPSEASHSTTSEQDTEAARRLASQTKTKAGGWASKSLLEREMENERTRQREWEEAQKGTRDAAARGVKDGGSGPGESWDVNQYGYMGGDSQNRGGPGLGGRRQILGPRPKP